MTWLIVTASNDSDANGASSTDAVVTGTPAALGSLGRRLIGLQSLGIPAEPAHPGDERAIAASDVEETRSPSAGLGRWRTSRSAYAPRFRGSDRRRLRPTRPE